MIFEIDIPDETESRMRQTKNCRKFMVVESLHPISDTGRSPHWF